MTTTVLNTKIAEGQNKILQVSPTVKKGSCNGMLKNQTLRENTLLLLVIINLQKDT